MYGTCPRGPGSILFYVSTQTYCVTDQWPASSTNIDLVTPDETITQLSHLLISTVMAITQLTHLNSDDHMVWPG